MSSTPALQPSSANEVRLVIHAIRNCLSRLVNFRYRPVYGGLDNGSESFRRIDRANPKGSWSPPCDLGSIPNRAPPDVRRCLDDVFRVRAHFRVMVGSGSRRPDRLAVHLAYRDGRSDALKGASDFDEFAAVTRYRLLPGIW